MSTREVETREMGQGGCGQDTQVAHIIPRGRERVHRELRKDEGGRCTATARLQIMRGESRLQTTAQPGVEVRVVSQFRVGRCGMDDVPGNGQG